MFGWKKTARRWEKSAEYWKGASGTWKEIAFKQRALNIDLLMQLRELLPKEYEGSEKTDKLLQELKDFPEESDSSIDSEEDHSPNLFYL